MADWMSKRAVQESQLLKDVRVRKKSPLKRGQRSLKAYLYFRNERPSFPSKDDPRSSLCVVTQEGASAKPSRCSCSNMFEVNGYRVGPLVQLGQSTHMLVESDAQPSRFFSLESSVNLRQQKSLKWPSLTECAMVRDIRTRRSASTSKLKARGNSCLSTRPDLLVKWPTLAEKASLFHLV